MRRLIPLIVVATNFLFAAGALACPFCKDSLPNSDALVAGGVPQGFNNSIYLMFTALFTMMVIVGFTLVKGARSSTGSRPVEPPQDGGFPLE